MILNELSFNEGRKVNKKYFDFFCKQNINVLLILDMYDTELSRSPFFKNKAFTNNILNRFKSQRAPKNFNSNYKIIIKNIF